MSPRPKRQTASLNAAALAAAFVLLVGGAIAAPRVPTDDAEVLERLPAATDPAAREARALADALSKNPGDLDIALRLARADIARGQTMADPRFMGRAEAALSPWIAQPDPPPPVRLMRGVLRQNAHDFDGSLADLDALVAAEPASSTLAAQARLTRAVVHQVRAEYAAAREDCGAIAGAVPRPAAMACTAGIASLTGHAHQAAIILAAVNAGGAGGASAVWSATLQGEVCARLGEDDAAERAFGQAIRLAPDDAYLLGAYADLLLDARRQREVIALLAERTRVDPLLLRLAIAERELGDPNPGHEAQLADRFETSRRRGETIHQREESRFALHIVNDPAGALRLAQANWHVQREPTDARILLEAAIAAGQPEAAAPALDWMRINGVEDVHLAALAAKTGS